MKYLSLQLYKMLECVCSLPLRHLRCPQDPSQNAKQENHGQRHESHTRREQTLSNSSCLKWVSVSKEILFCFTGIHAKELQAVCSKKSKPAMLVAETLSRIPSTGAHGCGCNPSSQCNLPILCLSALYHLRRLITDLAASLVFNASQRLTPATPARHHPPPHSRRPRHPQACHQLPEPVRPPARLRSSSAS